MRINAPHVLCAIDPPKDFVTALGKLPEGVSLITDTKASYNTLHWFVKTEADVNRETSMIMKLMKPDVTVWCYYPKGSSKIQTDLTRDKGWDQLMKHDWKWLSLISINDTWSAFAFRLKTEKDAEKEKNKPERAILQYADSKTKTIILPDELASAFAKNPKAKTVFDALAFSHRREYVEWIVTAKREETRDKRVAGTINMLLEGKKNPHN